MGFGGLLAAVAAFFAMATTLAAYGAMHGYVAGAHAYAALLHARRLSSLCSAAVASEPAYGTPDYYLWLAALNASAMADGFSLTAANAAAILTSRDPSGPYAVLQLDNA